jgi:large subunit ribosomal protein L18
MTVITNQKQKKIRRHARVRARVSGTAERPRLAVFRSNQHLYAQVINDVTGKTLAMASDLVKGKSKSALEPKAVGLAIAKAAIAVGVKQVAFDRGGYVYTGRVKALADGAREGGLAF